MQVLSEKYNALPEVVGGIYTIHKVGTFCTAISPTILNELFFLTETAKFGHGSRAVCYRKCAVILPCLREVR